MKVKFLGSSDLQVTYGGFDDPRPLLTVGEIYELEDQVVYSWYTEFYLKGIKGAFNSVCFEEVL